MLFDLATDSGRVKFYGSRISVLQQAGAAYLYRVNYEIREPERVRLLFALNRMIGNSPSIITAALDRYSVFDVKREDFRRIDLRM